MKSKELTNLKRQKTRLLNKQCETMEEFEIVQDKLNYVEAMMNIEEMKILKNTVNEWN